MKNTIIKGEEFFRRCLKHSKNAIRKIVCFANHLWQMRCLGFELGNFQLHIELYLGYGSTAQQSAYPTASQSPALNVLANQTVTFETFEEGKVTFTTYRQRLQNFFSINQIDEPQKNARKPS